MMLKRYFRRVHLVNSTLSSAKKIAVTETNTAIDAQPLIVTKYSHEKV